MEYISNSNSNSIYDFNNLTFDFDYKNRFINCLFDNEKNFMFETPFLKVLKPLHISNSKKNIELNKYIILETLNNLENNNEFMIVINKIHEISQENIKKNSKMCRKERSKKRVPKNRPKSRYLPRVPKYQKISLFINYSK